LDNVWPTRGHLTELTHSSLADTTTPPPRRM